MPIGYGGDSSSGGSDLYTNGSPVPADVGGIDSGDTFSNRTMTQMWNSLLYPVMYPVLSNPSTVISLAQSGLREIGETVPTLSFSTTFSRGSISPAYGTSGYRSGLPSSYVYAGSGLPVSVVTSSLSNSQTVSSYVVVAGLQVWTAQTNYDAGEQPRDSTGANYSSPLSAGITPISSTNINGVYPYFATTSSISVMTKQALAIMTSAYVQVTMVAEGGTDKQKIEFPIGWSAITGVQFYNIITSSWDWLGGSKANSLLTFTTSATTNTVQGNVISYTRYEYNGSTIGSRQLRFYTT